MMEGLSVNNAHAKDINVIATSYDDTELYSGSKDGVVKIWNVSNEDGEYKLSFAEHLQA